MKTIRAFKMQDDDGEHYAFECPDCGEINEIGDDFKWQDGGYKMTACCDYCDSDEVRITKSDEHIN